MHSTLNPTTKRTDRAAAWFLVVVLAVLVAPESWASIEVDGVFGLSPAGATHYVAVEISNATGQALTAVNWYHNDALTAFPSLVLMEGNPGDPPDLANTAIVLRDVSGESLTWAEAELEQAVTSRTGIIFAVFRFPDDQIRSADGAGGGPGLGYWHRADQPNPRAYISADGVEWTRMHPDFEAAVRPSWSNGKTAAVSLASLVAGGFGDEETTEAQQIEEARARVDTTPLTAFPNPFNPRTQIRLYLDAPGPSELTLYDLRGRKVATLLDEQLSPGEHFVTWEGTDGHGKAVASGVYFLEARLPAGVHRQRLVLVR